MGYLNRSDTEGYEKESKRMIEIGLDLKQKEAGWACKKPGSL